MIITEWIYCENIINISPLKKRILR